MSQICDVCGKTPQFGKSISHSHRRSSRRWSPNIQSVKASVKGATKRLKVCTSCIKAGKVNRAVKDNPVLRAERVQKAKESSTKTPAPASKNPSEQAPTAV